MTNHQQPMPQPSPTNGDAAQAIAAALAIATAAVFTLSAILAPAVRAHIDFIRSVESTNTANTLLLHSLRLEIIRQQNRNETADINAFNTELNDPKEPE